MSLSFWKPGTVGPGSILDRASQVEENIVSSAPGSSFLSTQEQLPISKHRECIDIPSVFQMFNNTIFICIKGEKLLYCVENYGVTIVVGQTGCGKTTRKLLDFSSPSSASSEILERTSSVSSAGRLG